MFYIKHFQILKKNVETLGLKASLASLVELAKSFLNKTFSDTEKKNVETLGLEALIDILFLKNKNSTKE